MRRREFTPPHRPLVRVRKQCMDAMLLDLLRREKEGGENFPHIGFLAKWLENTGGGVRRRTSFTSTLPGEAPACSRSWGPGTAAVQPQTVSQCHSVQTQQCHTQMNVAGCHHGPMQPRAWFPFLAFSCGFRPIFNCFFSSGKTSMWATGLCSVNYQVLRDYKYYHCYLFHPLVFCLPFLIGLGWRMSELCSQLYTSWAKRQCNVTFNTVYQRPPPSSEN